MRPHIAALITLLALSVSYGQTYTIDTFAGGGYGNPGGLGWLALDPAGDVFFTSSVYNGVFRLHPSGNVEPVAGNGTPGFSGDNGSAANAQLYAPAGIVTDPAGNLYIADQANQRIRKVSGGIISTVATDVRPSGMASDAFGSIYFVDGNVVRKLSNGVLTTVAGSGLPGQSGDGGPALAARLYLPTSVALDSNGDLYIADTGNRKIRKVSNGVITTVVDQLSAPTAVAFDAAGNLLIADSQSIQKMSNGAVTTIAGTGTKGFSGDGGPAVRAQLNGPTGLIVHLSGDIDFVDSGNSRIRRISNGQITTLLETGNQSYGGDGGPAAKAQLNSPRGIAVSGSGDLYIADALNSRIRKVSNGIISTVAGDGSLYLFGGDGGLATSAQLNVPTGVAVDRDGNFYINDTNNYRIRKVSNGLITTIAGNGLPSYAGDGGPAASAALNSSGIAVDPAGSVYLASGPLNNTIGLSIRKIANGTISRFAGLGSPGFSGDNGPAAWAQFSFLSSISFDPSGDLYIADGNRIRKLSNGVITTVAGNGIFGFSGDNGPATQAQLGSVEGVAVDGNGNLFFADYENRRIRRVSNGVITTIAGDGVSGFGGDGGPAAKAHLNAPGGVAVDAGGTVYFADSNNNRIRSLSPSGPSCLASLHPSTLSAIPAGGALTMNIETSASCAWAIQSLPEWITYSGAAVGAGPSAITLTVAPNAGGPRTGTVSVAGIPVPVVQDGSPQGPVIFTNGIAPVDSPVSIAQAGSWISIYGNNLSDQTALWNGDFPTSLAGVSVRINGRLGYLSFVSPGQINLQAPDDDALGPVSVTVTTPHGVASSSVTLAPHAPSFLMLDGRYAAGIIPSVDETGAYQNGAYDVIGPVGHFPYSSRPARRGEVVELYGVGFGATDPRVPAGQLFSGAAPASEWIQVTIGGQLARIQFKGITSTGLYQLNVEIPSTIESGDQMLQAVVGNGVGNSAAATRPEVYLSIQ